MIWAIMGKNKKWLERFFPLALSFFLFLGIYVGDPSCPIMPFPLRCLRCLALLRQGAFWSGSVKECLAAEGCFAKASKRDVPSVFSAQGRFCLACVLSGQTP